MPNRNELDQASCWDLSSLYSSYENWKIEMKQEIQEDYKKLFTPLSKKEISDPINLKGLLNLFFAKERHIRKLYTWAHLFHDQETALAVGREALAMSMHAFQCFREATSWIEPCIVQIPKKTLKTLIDKPGLSEYKEFLEKLTRMKPHTLSEREERLMAFSEKEAYTADKIFHAINDSDFIFPVALDSTNKAHKVTHASFQKQLRSEDRTLRENSFHSVLGTFCSFKNTVTEILLGQMNRHVFEKKARGYDSCLEASLFPKNIPTSLYKTFIETVRSHLPTLHRYMKIRKETLKLDTLKPWDMYVSIIPGYQEPQFTLEEAKNLVIQSCQPLGEDYINILKQGLGKDRWVDVYENKSKRSGAYSSGCYDSHPYILMNFKGLMRDAHTLAHEAGHSMHSFLSRRAQPYHLSEYEIFVAEVASTLNEKLLSDLLMQQAKSEKDRLFLILEEIEDIRATFFRQTLFAEFELFVHEESEKGTPLTAEFLDAKYKELYKDYYGPHLECTEELATEWARIPHFYMNFYVYQYATGISAAHALHEILTTSKITGQKQYLNFLQSGSKKFPIQLLQDAGVDMLSPEPYTLMINHFSELLDQLELGLNNLALKTRNC
jgi:oligoendopeptidase F